MVVVDNGEMGPRVGCGEVVGLRVGVSGGSRSLVDNGGSSAIFSDAGVLGCSSDDSAGGAFAELEWAVEFTAFAFGFLMSLKPKPNSVVKVLSTVF